MARILIASMPITGHVEPGLPIARALVARGHEVFWYTGRKFEARVAKAGARFLPIVHGIDFDDSALDERFPGRQGRIGLAQFRYDVEHAFVGRIPGQVRDLEAAVAEHAVDAMVCDTAFMGAPLVSERTGIPFATYGVSALVFADPGLAPFGLGMLPMGGWLGLLRNRFWRWFVDRVVFGKVNEIYQLTRARLGLERNGQSAFAATLSPYLYVQPTVASFEYPRLAMPPQVHFVGPFLPERSPDFEPPPWWNEVEYAPRVVHVTQGTAANVELDRLLGATIEALEGEDVLVVATTGGRATSTVRTTAKNARVHPFIPYAHLMPHVDVMITNGGYGGVQMALAHGVPLIVAGETEDKPEIARRIAWSGVGIDLRTQAPTPAAIRAAVRALDADSRYAGRAAAIAREMACYEGPLTAARLIETLVRTKRPVLERPAPEVASGVEPMLASL